MNTHRHRFYAVASLLIALAGTTLSGCAVNDRAAQSSATPAISNLGTHTWTITTTSPEAQRYFNQGLVWMYSFNHDEAVRHFKMVLELDPSCAMALWGIAVSNGPNINNATMDEARTTAAWSALQSAVAAAPGAAPMERALIDALKARYADPSVKPLPLDPAARAPFDKAYADAMARVHAQFPMSTDVATLYAESLMDLRPWDFWSLSGEPRPETGEIVRVLQHVLAANPNHPGANHLYIHAVEASNTPELADTAATRLRTLVPDSGHMVHMPAHIDVRMGRWNLAADQNKRAIEVHDRYIRVSPRQGFYRVYMMHNDHFLSYACMMSGRKREAIAAARSMLASIPEEFLRDMAPVADGYTPIEIEALLRFGEWDKVLALPEPRETLPITRSIWRFARGVSLAAKGDVAAARGEQVRFREQAKKVPAGAMMVANPAEKVLTIAEEMLEGEILYREGKIDDAVRHLRAAIAVEDTLNYMEPPDWVQPVRHALGAILLDAGGTTRVEQALDVYREDLRRWPENGWSLYGMAETLATMGKTDEAAEYRRRFKLAFSQSDIDLRASCLCSKRSVASAQR